METIHNLDFLAVRKNRLSEICKTNLGYFFKDFFDSNKDYFDLISSEHEFQTLTESNKQSNAFRKGIYLTHVSKDDKNNDIKFKLLRCSSNFEGSTDNFRTTDLDILDKVNTVSEELYPDHAELNHVLAQIYYNHKSPEGKDKKAKIKQHSDKTKDMSKNGLMAFCTFYKDIHLYDTNNPSIFTKLRFRLKKDVPNTDSELVDKFDIVLYPNSLFIMPLSTNRLYTHEIVPSCLPIDKTPTRMGYVIRCSNTNAIFKDGQTYIVRDNKLIKLEEPTDEGITKLKELYKLENITSQSVDYSNFYFSLNKGDYTQPIL